jgi:type II secretory pathway pseudopilin PulG
MILIVVLVVIALLSVGAVAIARLMMAERIAADMAGRQAQARESANSALEAVRIFLCQSQQVQDEAGGTYDNPTYFRGVAVNEFRGGLDDGVNDPSLAPPPRNRARFTLLSPAMEDGYYSGVRYGLEDESGRINLNALLAFEKLAKDAGLGDSNVARTILMSLPCMTEEIADAILDYIDTDDEPREYGAEFETYIMFDPPYAPKNGPLETIEELLLVPGVTPELLFGIDVNRNGMVDQGEIDAGLMAPDGGAGEMDRGWSAYFTLYGLEANARPDGNPRIDLNQEDLEILYDEVAAVTDEQIATYIVAYRQGGKPGQSLTVSAFLAAGAASDTGGMASGGATSSGAAASGGGLASTGSGSSGGASASGNQATTGEIDFERAGRVKFKSVLDLIGSTVTTRFKDAQQNSTLECPFPNGPIAMALYMPMLMDNFTVNANAIIPGRININTAPRSVLLGIPGLDEESVETILAERPQNVAELETGSPFRYETWLLQQGIIDLTTMKTLMPFICARGSVYRVQSVGYFDKDGPFARVEAVINAGTQPPRVVFWRDITNLGRGYSLEMLGTEYYGP